GPVPGILGRPHQGARDDEVAAIGGPWTGRDNGEPGHDYGVRVETTRAGMPTATAWAGTDSRTTAPAPITACSPIVTPSRIFAPAPIHAPSPTDTPVDVRV